MFTKFPFIEILCHIIRPGVKVEFHHRVFRILTLFIPTSTGSPVLIDTIHSELLYFKSLTSEKVSIRIELFNPFRFKLSVIHERSRSLMVNKTFVHLVVHVARASYLNNLTIYFLIKFHSILDEIIGMSLYRVLDCVMDCRPYEGSKSIAQITFR